MRRIVGALLVMTGASAAMSAGAANLAPTDAYVAALAAGQREAAVRALIALGRASAVENPSAAIFFGKQAVRLMQTRVATAPATRLGDDDAYRDAASLLLDQRRYSEAGRLLDIQKQQDIFEYLGVAPATGERLDIAYSVDERPLAARWQQVGDRLLAGTAQIGDADALRHDMLVLLGDSTRALAQSRPRDTALAHRPTGEAETPTAMRVAQVHYVLAQNELRVWVEAPEGAWQRAVPLDNVEFGRAVETFMLATRDPRLDPRPSGKVLYDVLIQPLKQGLAAAQVTVLRLSLPSELRSLPAAGLFDGERYLAERYALALATPVGDIARTRASPKPVTIVGMGVTKPAVIIDPETHTTDRFDELPAVTRELRAVVGENAGDGIVLDERFTAARLRLALNAASVVHIASHFRLRPDSAARSYLVLGNGETLSLRQMREQRLDFSAVDLLTLSACATGVGGRGADGREIEALGTVARAQGARAVIATLWSVNDASTAEFMRFFYTWRTQPGMGTAVALQAAQRQLLQSTRTDDDALRARMAERVGGPAPDARLPRYARDPDAPYAHPYYWAPFVLMDGME